MHGFYITDYMETDRIMGNTINIRTWLVVIRHTKPELLVVGAAFASDDGALDCCSFSAATSSACDLETMHD